MKAIVERRRKSYSRNYVTPLKKPFWRGFLTPQQREDGDSPERGTGGRTRWS